MHPSGILPGVFLISQNGKNGFQGHFDQVFAASRFEKLIIIQGGPGTGKSSIMRMLANLGSSFGAKVEEIRCSSDPASLDGVILEKGDKLVGMLDGTAPHARLAELPGAKEEIFNLGEHWNTGSLEQEKEVIFDLNRKKKQAYDHAYRLLKACGDCHEATTKLLLPLFLEKKAQRTAKRLLRPVYDTGVIQTRFIRAFSMRGEVILPQLEQMAHEVFALSGNEDAASLFLTVLADEANEKEVRLIKLPSPLCEEELDGIYIQSTKTLLIKEHLVQNREKIRKRIHMTRYIDSEGMHLVRTKLRALVKAEDILLKQALDFLKMAGDHHFALEKIYRTAMDFPRLRAAAQAHIRCLISLLPDEEKGEHIPPFPTKG